MIRLGSPSSETREMNLDDIFLSRLKLMIIMAKAFLHGFPLGEYRRRAMYENACHVETESIDLGGSPNTETDKYAESGVSAFDPLFYQRVKLLAVMVKAAAKGFPMGDHRQSAMKENLDVICQALMFNSQTENMAFLKVA